MYILRQTSIHVVYSSDFQVGLGTIIANEKKIKPREFLLLSLEFILSVFFSVGYTMRGASISSALAVLLLTAVCCLSDYSDIAGCKYADDAGKTYDLSPLISKK